MKAGFSSIKGRFWVSVSSKKAKTIGQGYMGDCPPIIYSVISKEI